MMIEESSSEEGPKSGSEADQDFEEPKTVKQLSERPSETRRSQRKRQKITEKESEESFSEMQKFYCPSLMMTQKNFIEPKSQRAPSRAKPSVPVSQRIPRSQAQPPVKNQGGQKLKLPFYTLSAKNPTYFLDTYAN